MTKPLDYSSDLSSWKTNIGLKRVMKACARAREIPSPRTARIVYLNGDNGAANGKQLDAQTDDQGNNRWEQFDVVRCVVLVARDKWTKSEVIWFIGQDAALRKADQEASSKQESREVLEPLPRTAKGREELEKEEGNAHYNRGHYVAAIKSYTRFLGYDPTNAVVLSNRAMAYVKNQEFANAEDDCTLALKADPTHVKSYSRRGTARNAMGKHRLALLDFHSAATLDPRSRQIQAQLQSTRELIRTAIKRSPKRTELSIESVGEQSMVNRTSENEEHLGLHQLKKPLPGTEQKSSPRQESASSLLLQGATSLQETHTQKKSLTIMPKLPKKAPVTSYEFCRVWKTLALRGSADERNCLLKLRADYLLMVDPATLRSVFKTAVESDVLCEIFHVLRYAVLSMSEKNSLRPTNIASFVLAFISELTKVPCFRMTVILLSDSEKEDVVWMIEYLEALVKKSNKIEKHEVGNLRKLYQLS